MLILVAEDDAQLGRLLERLLKAEGFTVLNSGDGVAALEVSRSYPGSIDLLLSDMSMPRMSGLELAKNIKAERPEIKVILMSGGCPGVETISTLGVPFLQKPFTPAALRECLIKSLRPTRVRAISADLSRSRHIIRRKCG